MASLRADLRLHSLGWERSLPGTGGPLRLANGKRTKSEEVTD